MFTTPTKGEGKQEEEMVKSIFLSVLEHEVTWGSSPKLGLRTLNQNNELKMGWINNQSMEEEGG